MSRLRHSAGGFARQMQISNYTLWAFVEGPGDRAFYSQMFRSNVRISGEPFRLSLAQEIPRRKGTGNRPLRILYRYLRRRKVLLSYLDGKRTVALVMLDKDVDDLCRCRLKSEHVIRTVYYTIENHIVRAGDLTKAMSSCAGLDVESVEKCLGNDNRAWARKAADRWKEWVIFAVFVRVNRLSQPNFGVDSSLIHNGPGGALDPATLLGFKARALAQSGWTPLEFDRRWLRAVELVDNHYAAGNWDLIFNGKWYSRFLEEDVKVAAAGRAILTQGLRSRFMSALLATCDFSGAWASHFHERLNRMADLR